MGLRVASGSMAPSIRAGDRIVVKAFTAGTPVVGDIVLLRTGDGWLVHRIIGRRGRDGNIIFRQKGDAGHRACDVPRSAIAGRVIRIEKADGIVELLTVKQKIVSSLVGRFFNLFDWLSRRGHGGEGRSSFPRLIVSRFLRILERAAARIAARP